MALVSNDFADETEYLKLLTMMMICSSRCYKKGVFQQSNELDPKIFPGLHSPDPQVTLAWRSLPSPSTSWIAPWSFRLVFLATVGDGFSKI